MVVNDTLMVNIKFIESENDMHNFSSMRPLFAFN